MAGGSQPYKQKVTTKMTSADKVSRKSTRTEKYSKSTTQDTYSTKNKAGEKYSSVKTTSCDKYSSGPAGEKYSVSRKTTEDKYSKSNGMDAHLKTKTSSKDTYVKGAETKNDRDIKSTDNIKTFSSKTPDKKDKMFCQKDKSETKPTVAATHTSSTWTSRPYNKEHKNGNKDDKNRGLKGLSAGAVAGVGVLAAAGPRKRNDEREKEINYKRYNAVKSDRDEQHNNAIPRDSVSRDGCCVLI